MHFQTLHML